MEGSGPRNTLGRKEYELHFEVDPLTIRLVPILGKYEWQEFIGTFKSS
ncbi:hypothetical protein Pla144_00030 [Bythopirellula polymerisocia]|uniref:Uncharacterized protein n=1 Tax=Bythopirellula polymerisocia TaxID=2528003 RepID=A0A5C6D0D8_9BACT|nr:hypothetical protein Pla144_00030 [Bythopirellula polymerisocia]